MKVLLDVSDSALRGTLAAELQQAGFTAGPLDAGLGESGVAVVQGAQRAETVAHSNPGLRVLALVAPDEMSALGPGVSGFAILPCQPGELLLRVRYLADSLTNSDQLKTKLLATAIESAGDVIEITSPDARLQYVNPAYERILGYSSSNVIGKTPAQVARSDYHPPEYFRELDRTLRSGKVWKGLLVSKAKSGSLVHFDCTIAPVRDITGEITHHVAVKRDISERIKREQALQETNRALEKAKDAALAASRSKSEFLANMSHELRTPLNAIIGYSELMMEDAQDDGDETTLSDLKKIKTAGTQLLELINDVLDISKIEAGRMDVYIETFELGPLVDSVLTTVTPSLKAKHNELTLETPENTVVLHADKRKVRQILTNLLGNAAKFTDNGNVTLRIEREHTENEPFIRFEVVDTGIGISKDKQASLFQPFVQADSSTTRRYGGTGLGLVISKRFAEIMGGDISLESQLGKGSTFMVRIPEKVGTPGQVSRSSIPRARPGSDVILLIDDDPSVRDELAEILKGTNTQLEFAQRGQSGLKLARQLKPKLIVLDVLMPEMDGWSVLTALKLDADTAEIPVLMLTICDQQDLGMALGAVDYYVKPIEPQRLLAGIRRILDQHDPNDSEVLLVEDDAPTRELIRRTLQDVGYRVVEAENGREGLEAVASHVPDFVVLDLMMPEVDGFQFLDSLRSQPELRGLPVMVVTAKMLSNEERARLMSSAQRLIEKNAHTRQQLLRLIGEQVRSMLHRPSMAPRM